MNNSQAMAIAFNTTEPVALHILTGAIFPDLDKLYLTDRLRFEYEMEVQPKQNGLTKTGFRKLFGLWQANEAEARQTSDPWLQFVRELAEHRKASDFSFRCFNSMGVWKTSEAHIKAAVKELLETGELVQHPLAVA